MAVLDRGMGVLCGGDGDGTGLMGAVDLWQAQELPWLAAAGKGEEVGWMMGLDGDRPECSEETSHGSEAMVLDKARGWGCAPGVRGKEETTAVPVRWGLPRLCW